MEHNDTALQVLLVEDSPGDVRLTQEAFREVSRPVQLPVANNGLLAIQKSLPLFTSNSNSLLPQPAYGK